MSIFSRRGKFRNLVSSAISTVVLSSCASQVVQCWSYFVAFDPDKNNILLDFVRVGDRRASEWIRIFAVTKDSVVSFDYAPKDGTVTNYLPFSSSKEKREDVEKLVSSLIAYFECCHKLFMKIGKFENFEKSCDMCLLRSSGRFWTSEGFFDLLNQKLDAAKKVYSSLKPEYKELIHSLRKQSDKIVKLYNSLSYKISDMFIDSSQRRLWVIADKPENVYVDENIKKLLSIRYVSLVNRNQMIDESCKPEDEWDWSWPKSGELIELDRYTDFRLDPNFYLDN